MCHAELGIDTPQRSYPGVAAHPNTCVGLSLKQCASCRSWWTACCQCWPRHSKRAYRKAVWLAVLAHLCSFLIGSCYSCNLSDRTLQVCSQWCLHALAWALSMPSSSPAGQLKCEVYDHPALKSSCSIACTFCSQRHIFNPGLHPCGP